MLDRASGLAGVARWHIKHEELNRNKTIYSIVDTPLEVPEFYIEIKTYLIFNYINIVWKSAC